jgi:prepilin-type N-terminal cleavage/methylation domain-containing protein
MERTMIKSSRREPAARRSPRGFTLVELLVVIGIIVLLISILLPMVNKARKDAKRVSISSDLMGISQALDQYKDDFGDYPRLTSAFPTDSNGKATTTPSTGAVALCWALIAPGPATQDGAGNPSVTPDPGAPGFRLHGTGQGKVYGAYLNTDRYRVGNMPKSGIAVTIPPASPIDDSNTAIADSEGNVILYFPGNKQVSPTAQSLLDLQPIGYGNPPVPPTCVYNYNDNVPPLPTSGTLTAVSPTLTPKLMAYKLGAASALPSTGGTAFKAMPGDTPIVAPYLLWSAGPDSVLGPGAVRNGTSATTAGDDDDVTYPETVPVPGMATP